MERVLYFVFLWTSVEGKISHFLNSTPQTWSGALAYCRLHYMDLSYVGSQSDQVSLLQAAGNSSPAGWIGMHRRLDNQSIWYWTWGEDVTYLNWESGQPSNSGGIEDACQLLKNGRWNDLYGGSKVPFYCMDISVETEMSWEEALQFCRQNQSNLPDLRSQSDLFQVQKVLQLRNVTDAMWVGLRYVRDLWLWMSGDPLGSSAWPQRDHDWLCPAKRCGALSKSGGLMSWDCQDRLNFICT